MLICTKCGHEADEAETFCGRCGAFLEWTGARAAAPDAAVPGGEEPPAVPPAAPASRHAAVDPEPAGPAVVATLSASAVRVEPGGRATVSVEVRNRGRTVDQLLVDVLGPAAPWSTVDPPRLNLMPGTAAVAVVAFQPPRSPTVRAGANAVEITIRSSQHPDASIAEALDVEVAPFVDFDVSLAPSVLRGAAATACLLHAANNGNAPLELSLAADDPEAAFTFGINPPHLRVDPATATDALVVAKPRAPLEVGPDRTRPFRVVATAGDGSRRVLAGSFVQVPAPAPPPPPAPVPVRAPLVTTLSASAVQVEPGGRATVTVDVENRNPTPDRATIEAHGPAATWAVIEPTRLPLGPRGSAAATVAVGPPRTPPPQPGRYPLDVSLRSTEQPALSVVGRVMVDVLPFAALEATLSPSVLRGGREATTRLRVANRGNATVDVAVGGDDPEIAFEFGVSPAKLRLKSGAVGDATVRVKARKENRTRGDLARPFRVHLASTDGSSLASDGTFVQEASRGRRRWPAAVVLLALLGAAVAIIGLDPGLLDGIGLPTAAPAVTDPPQVDIITPAPLPVVTCSATEPDDWRTLEASSPQIVADRPLCVLWATLSTTGSGSGPVRVLAGDAEVISFDMANFDAFGEEGAGSGERTVRLGPAPVAQGQTIVLDTSGCVGDGCDGLLVQLAVAGGS